MKFIIFLEILHFQFEFLNINLKKYYYPITNNNNIHIYMISVKKELNILYILGTYLVCKLSSEKLTNTEESFNYAFHI